MKWMKFDPWSGTWLFGSYFLHNCFEHLIKNQTIKNEIFIIIAVLICGVLKELSDEIWYLIHPDKENWIDLILDRRGGDWKDLVFCLIGAILGILI